jgi:GT2 family glycosyltransferase
LNVNKNPLVSAIVTNYNGWALGLLQEFFPAFLKGDFQDFEIFLQDNGSTDESIKKVKEKFGKDIRIKYIENPGGVMSSGIDMAIKQAIGKYVLFLNNDIYFEKGAIKKMISYLERNSNVALVQGKFVSYYDHHVIDDVGESMDVYGNPVTLGQKEEDIGQYNEVIERLSVSGAASLIKADLLKKFGMLDPDYGIGYEDMDLALRLRIAGYKMFYLPEVLVYHRRGSSVSQISESKRAKIKFDFNKNRLSTMFKNYQISTLLKSLPVVIGIYLIIGLFEIFYKKLWRFGITRYTSIIWVIFNLGVLLRKRTTIQSLRKLNDQEAFLHLMTKGRLLSGFKDFIQSKRW